MKQLTKLVLKWRHRVLTIVYRMMTTMVVVVVMMMMIIIIIIIIIIATMCLENTYSTLRQAHND